MADETSQISQIARLPNPKETPDGVPDSEVILNPNLDLTVQLSQVKPMFNYQPGSVQDMAYGASNPNTMASQLMQSGQLFRVSRGFPFKRAGKFVPVLPKFKAQTVTIQNLSSQPQSNVNAQQISQPTSDPHMTNTSDGTAYIGYPGFVKADIL